MDISITEFLEGESNSHHKTRLRSTTRTGKSVPVADAGSAAVATVGTVDGLLALRQRGVLARPEVRDLEERAVSNLKSSPAARKAPER